MELDKLKFAELPPQLRTDVRSIDMQHVAIITIINHLSACSQEGQGKEQLPQIMKFLESYVTTHFNDEEKYMKKHDYPHLKDHIIQHKIFKRFVTDLKIKVKSDTINPTLHIKAIITLKEWISNHIEKVDIIMAAHIRQGSNKYTE